MTQVDIAAASLFGYDKNELTNKKVNEIMPPLYAKYHDKFLDNYLNNKESKYFSRDRLLFGKNKSGFIFPVFIIIKVVY